MNIQTRRQERLEEAKRIEELEEYFLSHSWDWKWKRDPNIQLRQTRKLFKDEAFQLLKPPIKREA